MEEGDHVVCVDDKFPLGIAKFYSALPKEGVSYVIRDVRIGINLGGEGDISLLLVGLVNPRAASRAALERGFRASRFRPIEERHDSQAAVRTQGQTVTELETKTETVEA